MKKSQKDLIKKYIFLIAICLVAFVVVKAIKVVFFVGIGIGCIVLFQKYFPGLLTLWERGTRGYGKKNTPFKLLKSNHRK